MLFLLVQSLFSAKVTASKDTSIYPMTEVVYHVENSNETANLLWFTSDFTESFTYNIPIDSEIQVTFLDRESDNPFIDISVGNLTRQGILDEEAENNLALGYWKVSVFGFAAVTDWNVVNTQLQQAGFVENQNYTLRYTTFFLTGINASIDAVNITFNDLFQSTSLVYSRVDGTLLSARTGFGNYYLQFSAIKISMIKATSSLPPTETFTPTTTGSINTFSTNSTTNPTSSEPTTAKANLSLSLALLGIITLFVIKKKRLV